VEFIKIDKEYEKITSSRIKESFYEDESFAKQVLTPTGFNVLKK
jgi:hypothetical protein